MREHNAALAGGGRHKMHTGKEVKPSVSQETHRVGDISSCFHNHHAAMADKQHEVTQGGPKRSHFSTARTSKMPKSISLCYNCYSLIVLLILHGENTQSLTAVPKSTQSTTLCERQLSDSLMIINGDGGC